MKFSYEIRDILNIGIEITTEKNKHHLLEKMLNKAMEISGCDAGTLYVLHDGMLHFSSMKTISMGVDKGKDREEIDLPPVALKLENVCAYAALKKELVNIPDVYHSSGFDFSGPVRYDKMTGYHTKSMLVIPMEDAEGHVIGVVQLINKLDSDGNVIAFTDEDAFILRSLGSMAAVSMTNMIYLDEIKQQMQSFVQAFATAIDKRTPYNGSHTRMVTEYAVMVAEQLNLLYQSGQGGEPFDTTRMEQLRLAAGLHDIGKMVVPLSVMNKSTRLEGGYKEIEHRFAYLRLLFERDLLKGRLSSADYEAKIAELDANLSIIAQVNTAGFLSDELLNQINTIAKHSYHQDDGTVIAYLTEHELSCLRIRKGTLTSEERSIMEGHSVMTEEILAQVYFSDTYKNVPRYASQHHEFLDGSGYPNGLRGDELSMETRILTVVDIFDALTCSDRPYKKPMSNERAFAILNQMADEGKLDRTVINALEEAILQPQRHCKTEAI
ncbi:MAG: GAF domain-containing protein [Clostridia bacterium]|nr:GAF domain-containing protein [Clostridia bacterium]